MNEDSAIELFLTFNIDIRGYSLNTRIAYESDIKEFQNFIHSEKQAKDLLSIRNDRVPKNYVASLGFSDLKATSINRKISSLRSFYDFLVDKKIIKVNFFSRIETPKNPKKSTNINKDNPNALTKYIGLNFLPMITWATKINIKKEATKPRTGINRPHPMTSPKTIKAGRTELGCASCKDFSASFLFFTNTRIK